MGNTLDLELNQAISFIADGYERLAALWELRQRSERRQPPEPMKSADYLAHAQQCRAAADLVRNKDNKTMLLEMAEEWQALAANP